MERDNSWNRSFQHTYLIHCQYDSCDLKTVKSFERRIHRLVIPYSLFCYKWWTRLFLLKTWRRKQTFRVISIGQWSSEGLMNTSNIFRKMFPHRSSLLFFGKAKPRKRTKWGFKANQDTKTTTDHRVTAYHTSLFISNESKLGWCSRLEQIRKRIISSQSLFSGDQLSV
jgi:hypothetical protein